MTKRPIIIDCDPGLDDAINLLLAIAAPEAFDVLGITTVAGNVSLELTTRNARLVCDLAGSPAIPVFRGCGQPLQRALVTAEKVHGRSGIGDYPVAEPRHPLADGSAVDFLVATLGAAAEQSVTLVLTGPLTNIATAIRQSPDIVRGIAEIVLMGGARREGGNYTPSAEFNIFVDPHAADAVLKCGRPITALGLDLTHQLTATRDRRDRVCALANDAGRAVCGMLDYLSRHDPTMHDAAGAPLHDPCTCAWLLAPDLFTGRLCHVAVETRSELTMGHTAVDFWHVTDGPRNVNWIHHADADGFYDLLTERLRRYDGG